MGIKEFLGLVLGKTSGVDDEISQSDYGFLWIIGTAAQSGKPLLFDKFGQLVNEATFQILASNLQQFLPSAESRSLYLFCQGVLDGLRELTVLPKQIA